MEYPVKAEEVELVDQVLAVAKKLRCLKRTQIGTEKSRGLVLPGGECVLLMRVTWYLLAFQNTL